MAEAIPPKKARKSKKAKKGNKEEEEPERTLLLANSLGHGIDLEHGDVCYKPGGTISDKHEVIEEKDGKLMLSITRTVSLTSRSTRLS